MGRSVTLKIASVLGEAVSKASEYIYSNIKSFAVDDNGNRIFWGKYGLIHIDPEYMTFFHHNGRTVFRMKRKTNRIEYLSGINTDTLNADALEMEYSVCSRAMTDDDNFPKITNLSVISDRLVKSRGIPKGEQRWLTY